MGDSLIIIKTNFRKKLMKNILKLTYRKLKKNTIVKDVYTD